MLRGVWQALNIVFSFMQRFAWLPQGRPQGKQKMKAGVRKIGDFYRAMLCVRYMPSCDVRPSVYSFLLIFNISQKIRWAQFSFRYDDRLSNKRWIQLRWLTAAERSAYVFISELVATRSIQCIFRKRRYHGTLLSARNHWRQRSRNLINLYAEKLTLTVLPCTGSQHRRGRVASPIAAKLHRAPGPCMWNYRRETCGISLIVN